MNMTNPPPTNANPMKYEDTALMHLAPMPTPVAAVALHTEATLCSLLMSHAPTAMVTRLRKIVTFLVTFQTYN